MPPRGERRLLELSNILIANRALPPASERPLSGSSPGEESLDIYSSISKKYSEVKKIKPVRARAEDCLGRKKVKKMTHMARKLFGLQRPVCCRLTLHRQLNRLPIPLPPDSTRGGMVSAIVMI